MKNNDESFKLFVPSLLLLLLLFCAVPVTGLVAVDSAHK
jgi:hypothetical protein